MPCMSFLCRPACNSFSKSICLYHNLSRCSSFSESPRVREGFRPPAVSAVDMGRRHRGVAVPAESETALLEAKGKGNQDEEALIKMWQGFGRTQSMPTLVKKLMQNTKALEEELGEELKFGGPRGSLKGLAGATEDHRHRAFYHTLPDSEAKLQFFATRQVACRILGSHGYLCEACWLPLQDCMCSALDKGSLWKGIHLWVFMHPKDFLRKNNTGKLLWQALGDQAQLCVCGIQQHEDAMWAAFQQAGRDHVWCVYPAKNESEITVKEINPAKEFRNYADNASKYDQTQPLHFIMIDGTWSNSKAMVSRLQERAALTWDGLDMPCIALSPDEFSAIHGLRPQPSIEKTCTAAAAAQLLRELHQRPFFVGHSLDKTADTIDNAVNTLSEALVDRRRRVGRPLVRNRRQELRIH